jgi:hypothetical protein
MRRYVPFGVAVALAAVVVLGDRFVWPPGITYALIGLFAGVLLVVGPLFAFGEMAFKRRDPVEAHVAAVGAGNGDGGDAATEGYAGVRLVRHRLHQRHLVRENPVFVAAEGASRVRVEFVEDVLETVDMGRHGRRA